jgi:hypothetical protein
MNHNCELFRDSEWFEDIKTKEYRICLWADYGPTQKARREAEKNVRQRIQNINPYAPAIFPDSSFLPMRRGFGVYKSFDDPGAIPIGLERFGIEVGVSFEELQKTKDNELLSAAFYFDEERCLFPGGMLEKIKR